jgi:hypothetical protein
MAGQWYSLGSLSNIMWSVPATCSRSVAFFSYSIQHFVKFVSDLWQVYGFYLSILCIMWSSLSVTYGRSVIFSRYSIQHHVMKRMWPKAGQWYSLDNILWSLSVTCDRSMDFIWVFYASCDQVCRWPMAGQWYYLGTLYNIMWSSLLVTEGRSVVFSMKHFVKFVSDLWHVNDIL